MFLEAAPILHESSLNVPQAGEVSLLGADATKAFHEAATRSRQRPPPMFVVLPRSGGTVMNLLIDDREDSPRIKEVQRRYPFDSEVRRLAVGDYVLGDTVFEMKTCTDFLASMMDGRLAQQLNEMDANYPGKAFLVISGSMDEARYTRKEWRTDDIQWGRLQSSYLGQLWSIMERHQVRILKVRDTAEFCDLLTAKAKRIQRGDKKVERPLLTLKSMDRSLAMEAEDVLAAISGIGRSAARALLTQFKSIEAIVAASPKELSETPEIGKVRAVHIHDVLTGKHTQEQTI